MTSSMLRPPLFDRLQAARRVLIAGAGGGFDVFAGLPLFFALRAQGKEVHLANLTFSYLGGTTCDWLAPGLARVDARTEGETQYFPEKYLCAWLETQGVSTSVFCFEKRGVVLLRAAHALLVERLDLDAIVLLDGGTDILMRGDEAGLGTPAEDMVSLAAVAGLASVPTRVICCLGFGVDAFHGVCHAHFLENVAALDTEGAFLGAFSLLGSMPEGARFRDAVLWVHDQMPERQSIVNGSIVSALEGRFGDYHRTDRTHSSTLFISPLMCLIWSFDLAAVARRSLYLQLLEGTESIFDVGARIEAFRKAVPSRPRTIIPV